jgi:PAS domain S-box-containing protein
MINRSLLAMLKTADALVQLLVGRTDGVYPEVLSAGAVHHRGTATERVVVRNYRILCVFAGIAFPLFLVIAHVFDLPRKADDIGVRLAGSVSFFALLVGSYFPGFRRWFIRGVRAILFLFAGWIVYLSWVNRFSIDFVISLMMVVPGIGFLMASRRSFVAFAFFITGAVGIALYTVRDPAVHPAYLFACIAAFNIFIYLILNTKLAVMEGLIQGEELRQVFIDHSSESFVLIDPIRMKVLECNRKAREMFEIPEVMDDDRVIADIFGQSEWRTIDAALVLKECINQGVYRRVRAYLTRSGRSFWGDLVVVQVKMGRYHLLLVRVADITARKQLEDRLTSAETHYGLIADYTHDVLLRFKPDGTVTHVSSACRSQYGYETFEATGRKLFEFVHEDYAEGIKNWLASKRTEDDYFSGRYRIRRKDGEYVWVESVSRKVRDPVTGELKETDIVIRNISDLIRLESGGNKA